MTLAGLLRAAGYEAERIQERLGTGEELLARSPELPAYVRRLGDADALAVLVRLLLLGVPVARTRLDELVQSRLARLLLRSGLLLEDGDRVHGAARLVPHDELLIASDRAGDDDEDAAAADHVPGVHRPSVALAHLTVRRRGEHALDVGTGNGIQAILLAAHAQRVLATDVNPRALAYAAFNAALNGAGNVETRAGSFFEPVAGERFDLVVANPPYVVSPERAYLFRDGGLRGDAVSEAVVRAAPDSLAPGAFASILISWVLDPDDPVGRPRSWVEGSACDALLLHTSTDEPLEAAALWNRDLRGRPDAYAEALDRWLAYYRELGARQLGYACLVLRRRGDGRDGWFRAQQLPRAALRPAGAHLLKLFETQDRLSELPAAGALLGRRLSVAEDAVATQEMRFSGGRWRAESLTLRLQSGLPFSADLDEPTGRLIRALDGSTTLREAIAAAVEDGGATQPGLELARRMLEVGFLELAD